MLFEFGRGGWIGHGQSREKHGLESSEFVPKTQGWFFESLAKILLKRAPARTYSRRGHEWPALISGDIPWQA